jgi:hypothetical protein
MPTSSLQYCDLAWSDEPRTTSPTDSRCWLMGARSLEEVCAVPSGVRLPAAHSTRTDVRRFELPAGIAGRPGDRESIQLALREGFGVDSEIVCSRPTDVGRFRGELPEDLTTLTAEEREAIDAQNVIGQHIELVNTACDDAPADPLRRQPRDGVVAIEFVNLVRTWKKTTESADARYSLIVRIATEVASLLEDVCRRPRRVLRRERAMEDLARIAQVDAACIRWISRQPGRSVAEKAGPKQQLLSVVRVEHADTLENRVLRDFAVRAIRESDAYCVENRAFRDGPRVQLVSRFRRLLHRLLRETDLATVSPLSGYPEPNYVLMFDQRYKIVWHWYQKLRRLQQEQEDLWRWRHRVWAEIVLCNILVTLHELSAELIGDRPLFRSPLYLRQEPQDAEASGRFLDARSLFPSFIGPQITNHMTEVAVPDQAVADQERESRLGRLRKLNPDIILRTGPLSVPAADRSLVGVWTEFTPSGSEDDVAAEASSLEDTIKSAGITGISGVLARPYKRDSAGNSLLQGFDFISQGSRPTWGCRLPMDQKQAVNYLKQALPVVLGTS